MDGLGVRREDVVGSSCRWALTGVSGLLSAAAFPPWDVGWIAFVG
jgi:apolipoprotein N-acyltransferase